MGSAEFGEYLVNPESLTQETDFSSRAAYPALSRKAGLSVGFFPVHNPERVDDAFGLVDAKYYPEIANT